MKLCARCSDLMRERHFVKVVYRDIDHKIVCENCNRTAYGGTYEVTPLPKEKRHE